jgi:zinc protease
MNRLMAPPYNNTADLDIKLMGLQKQKLANHVLLYSLNAGAQDVVQIEWIFTAGNSYENSNMIASTAVSLLTSGTSTHTAFEISEIFEQHGAFLNCTCYNETIVVNLSCLTKHIEALLPTMVSIFSDATYPQTELDLYIKKSKQQLDLSLTKATFIANRLTDAALYGAHHPYAKLSEHHYLDALTRANVVTHYDDYIRNGRCTIMVSGKTNDALIENVARHFETMPWRGILKFHLLPNPFPKPQAIQKRSVINDPKSVQGSIRIAQPLPNKLHPHFRKLQFLNTVFGGYFGSRLMSNIREDKGYTYGIHSYLENHLQVSAWVITTDAGKDVCTATIEEVYKEMEILRTELIDDEEMQLVRNYLMGSILGQLDGPFQIMGRWKNLQLNGLDENYFYDHINIIKTITAEELMALANEYLRPELFQELVVY